MPLGPSPGRLVIDETLPGVFLKLFFSAGNFQKKCRDSIFM